MKIHWKLDFELPLRKLQRNVPLLMTAIKEKEKKSSHYKAPNRCVILSAKVFSLRPTIPFNVKFNLDFSPRNATGRKFRKSKRSRAITSSHAKYHTSICIFALLFETTESSRINHLRQFSSKAGAAARRTVSCVSCPENMLSAKWRRGGAL